jgi:hypothetical protein
MTDQNNSNPRRTFLLQAAGLTGAGSLLKAASPADAAGATAPVPSAAPDAASVPYQSLSPDEATFIEALVNVTPFSGIPDAAERAAVIAYLRTLR